MKCTRTFLFVLALLAIAAIFQTPVHAASSIPPSAVRYDADGHIQSIVTPDGRTTTYTINTDDAMAKAESAHTQALIATIVAIISVLLSALALAILRFS